ALGELPLLTAPARLRRPTAPLAVTSSMHSPRMGSFMYWRAVFFLVAGLTAAATGCCCPRRDRVESELRARDNDLRVLRGELERSKPTNPYLDRECPTPHPPAASPGPGDGPPPASRVKSITLGRQTGGYEEDGVPGDEALQVVLQPIDFDGHTIKA